MPSRLGNIRRSQSKLRRSQGQQRRGRFARLLCEKLEQRLLLTVADFAGDLEHTHSDQPDYVEGQLIVGFETERFGPAQLAHQLYGIGQVDQLSGGTWQDSGVNSLRSLLTFDSGEDVYALADLLSSIDGVAYAEPNYRVSIAAIPNDANFGSLWGMHNTGQSGGTDDIDVDAPEAWDIQTGNLNTVVGVIDTGIDYRHPDLYENIWLNEGEIPTAFQSQLNDVDSDGKITFIDLNDSSNWIDGSLTSPVRDLNGNNRIDAGDLFADSRWEDGVDTDGNGYTDDFVGWDFHNNDNDPFDDHSHGTHVSGTIGGIGNNSIGVAGVSWRVQMMGLKFLAADGTGDVERAVNAQEYANAMNANMTSNSWGGGGYSIGMFNAVSASRDANMLFIAAAGNEARDNDVIGQYPANYNLDNVISVAAIDRNNVYASFSSYGATKVHLAAPGVAVMSSTPNGLYASFNGTSMATPHVAGAAALIWSQAPGLTQQEVKQLILDSVDPVPVTSKSTLTNGRLNVFTAISAFENDVTPPATIDDLVAHSATRTSVELTWTATGDDGTEGMARYYDVRYATTPILTEADWDAATPVLNEPRPSAPGSTETLTVDGLFHSTTHYFSARVLDNAGNQSGLSNIAQQNTEFATSVLKDDVEEAALLWTPTGLWHRSEHRSRSPSHSWYYGIENEWNYETGSVNSGTLTSQPLDLTNAEDAFLQFSEWSQVESFSAYDRTRVQVTSLDSDPNWETVYESHGTDDQWELRHVDLSGYVGEPIALRFYFDTGDTAQNHFEGWHVDNISVYSSAVAAAIHVSPDFGLETDESGRQATFEVTLSSPPQAPVTIGLSSSDETEGIVSPSSLVFDPADWSTPQIVTVTGIDDPEAPNLVDDDILFSIVTAPSVSIDPNYGGLDPNDVTVKNINLDLPPDVLVTPTSGLTTDEEGSQASFTVSLATEPLAPVTIPIESSDTTEGVLSQTEIVFDLGNWHLPQTVVVTGIDDPEGPDFVDPDVGYSIVLSPAQSDDSAYEGFDPADVSLQNYNLDVPPFRIEHGDHDVPLEGMSVAFAESFTSPVVVTTPNYGGQSVPSVVRLSNVSGTGFDVQMVDLQGNAVAGSFHFVVVEQGDYRLPGGVKIEAFTFETNLVDHSGSWTGTTRSLINQYEAPVVIGQVMSSNDSSWSTFWSGDVADATAPAAGETFRAGMQVGEDSDVTRASETIGYIVIESGFGLLGDSGFEARVGSETVGPLASSAESRYELHSRVQPETAVLSLAGMRNTDGAWAVLNGTEPLAYDSIRLATDEDTLGDAERDGPWDQASYFVLTELDGLLPTLTIDDVVLDEGNSGSQLAQFTVSLSEIPSSDVSVNFETQARSATASIDFLSTSGQLHFAAGTTTLSQVVSVAINGDLLDEFDESFAVVLSEAEGASVLDGIGEGVIANDDITPNAVVTNGVFAEGSHGSSSAAFTISLSAPSGKDIWVQLDTVEDTATENDDYYPLNMPLFFPAGLTQRRVKMKLVADQLDEHDETFEVQLSAPENVVIGSGGVGVATILDDDVSPTVSITGMSAEEGHSGTSDFGLTVTLSEVSGREVEVSYQAIAGSAIAGEDFASTNATIMIPAGALTGTATVPVVGDALFEEDESFTVELHSPLYATLGNATATATIINDDVPPGEAKIQTLIESSNSTWKQVTLPHSYNSMVVVGTPNYDGSLNSGVVRVRNAGGSQFEFIVQGTLSGQAMANVPVHFLVIEEGQYDSVGGLAMEAVKFESAHTDNAYAWSGQSQTYQNQYTNPVVVGQVMSANDPDWSVFWASGSSVGSPPSASTLKVGKHVGEDFDSTRVTETIGYIVMESGTGVDGSLSFGGAVGADIVQGIDNAPPYNYSSPIANPQVVIASAAGMDGWNGGWPILYGTNAVSNNIGFAYDEDEIGDSERWHTTEQVAFLAFALPAGGSNAFSDANSSIEDAIDYSIPPVDVSDLASFTEPFLSTEPMSIVSDPLGDGTEDQPEFSQHPANDSGLAVKAQATDSVFADEEESDWSSDVDLWAEELGSQLH